MGTYRPVALLLAAALLAVGLAGCNVDRLMDLGDALYETAGGTDGGALDDGAQGGGAYPGGSGGNGQDGGEQDGGDSALQGPIRSETPTAPSANQASNSLLVPLTSGAGMQGMEAAGGENGFYQAVQSGDNSACYFLYTSYATGETEWLTGADGQPVSIPGCADGVAVLPAGDKVFLVGMGSYEWNGEQQGGVLYSMNADGTGLRVVLEMADNRVFHPMGGFVYDGEGVYCNIIHYNGAKGTADVVLLYIYEDGGEYVEMKYYPLEGTHPLVAGAAAGQLLLRTVSSQYGEWLNRPDTWEEYVCEYEYALYSIGSGGTGEVLASYSNADTAGLLEGTRLYMVSFTGAVDWYDFDTGEGGRREYEFGLRGSLISPAYSTPGSVAGVWGGQLVVTLETRGAAHTYVLDTYADEGWLQTRGNSLESSLGIPWAYNGRAYVVRIGLDTLVAQALGKDTSTTGDEAIAELLEQAAEWLYWPFEQPRPESPAIFAAITPDGLWGGYGFGDCRPLLPTEPVTEGV